MHKAGPASKLPQVAQRFVPSRVTAARKTGCNPVSPPSEIRVWKLEGHNAEGSILLRSALYFLSCMRGALARHSAGSEGYHSQRHKISSWSWRPASAVAQTLLHAQLGTGGYCRRSYLFRSTCLRAWQWFLAPDESLIQPKPGAAALNSPASRRMPSPEDAGRCGLYIKLHR